MNSTFLQDAIARLLYASTRRTGEIGNHFWEGMAMDIGAYRRRERVGFEISFLVVFHEGNDIF
jgi:hypothetical protein